MLKAIHRSGQAFNFATEEFKNNHASVLQAVQTKGSALQFAPQVCHGDRALVIEATRQNCSSLAFADEALREDPEFVNEALNPMKIKKDKARRGSKSKDPQAASRSPSKLKKKSSKESMRE